VIEINYILAMDAKDPFRLISNPWRTVADTMDLGVFSCSRLIQKADDLSADKSANIFYNKMRHLSTTQF